MTECQDEKGARWTAHAPVRTVQSALCRVAKPAEYVTREMFSVVIRAVAVETCRVLQELHSQGQYDARCGLYDALLSEEVEGL